VISTAASRAVVRVIHTNEELMIAKTVSQLLAMEQNKEK
jgi:acetate kinase